MSLEGIALLAPGVRGRLKARSRCAEPLAHVVAALGKAKVERAALRIALAGLFDPSPAQGEAGLEVEPANKPGLPKLPLKVLSSVNDDLGRIVLRDKLARTGVIGGLG